MDTNSKNYKNTSGVYSVKNPQRIFVLLFLEAVVIAALVFLLVQYGKTFDAGFLMYAFIVFLVALFLFYVCKANFPGIVVDAENDKISFPGGGVSANSFLEYISPKFWIQPARRFEYQLSSISSVSPDVEVRTNVSKEGRVSRHVSYRVCISGSFGSAKISVDDDRKMQELISLLVGLLDMGIPVSNR